MNLDLALGVNAIGVPALLQDPECGDDPSIFGGVNKEDSTSKQDACISEGS